MQSLLPRVTLHLNHHFKALVLRPSTNKRFSQVNCAKALAMHEAGAATCCSSGALQPADDAPSTSGRTLPITSRVRSPPASPTHPAKRRRIHTVTAAAASQQPAKPAATGKKAAPAAAELQDDSSMWMIVGLGNPGANYERTRCTCHAHASRHVACCRTCLGAVSHCEAVLSSRQFVAPVACACMQAQHRIPCG